MTQKNVFKGAPQAHPSHNHPSKEWMRKNSPREGPTRVPPPPHECPAQVTHESPRKNGCHLHQTRKRRTSTSLPYESVLQQLPTGVPSKCHATTSFLQECLSRMLHMNVLQEVLRKLPPESTPQEDLTRAPYYKSALQRCC